MPVSHRDYRLSVPPAHGPQRRESPRRRPTGPRHRGRTPSPGAQLKCDCVCTCARGTKPLRPEAWLAPRSPQHPHVFAPAPAASLPQTPGDLEAALVGPADRAPSRYDTFASAVSYAAGTPWCFYGAVVGVIAWGACGKVAHGSNSWQLVLNTSSSIITMLMCFILQNTLNRDTRVLHLQLQRLMQEVQMQQGAQAQVHLPKVTITEQPCAPASSSGQDTPRSRSHSSAA